MRTGGFGGAGGLSINSTSLMVGRCAAESDQHTLTILDRSISHSGFMGSLFPLNTWRAIFRNNKKQSLRGEQKKEIPEIDSQSHRMEAAPTVSPTVPLRRNKHRLLNCKIVLRSYCYHREFDHQAIVEDWHQEAPGPSIDMCQPYKKLAQWFHLAQGSY